MPSRAEARADRIVKVILRAGDISVQEHVDQVRTSATSIRRDLARLEKEAWICAHTAERPWQRPCSMNRSRTMPRSGQESCGLPVRSGGSVSPPPS
jgi:predicted ArsR family transcriptional regulator